MMNVHIKTSFSWLFCGPALALMISFASWYFFNWLTPGKLHSMTELVSTYPLGLIMSLLTPWGWLMYGGLIMMLTGRMKMGMYITLTGALVLGIFWPIWSMSLA